MKSSKVIIFIITITLLSTCKKDNDFEVPGLLCSSPSEDIEYVRSSIIGEWKSTENEGQLSERGYESYFMFTDSTKAVKIIRFNDNNDESEISYNYSIKLEGCNTLDEFIINLLSITPNINRMRFCEDEFIIFNEEQRFFERYERN